jgi:hypothetical protein
MNNKTIYKFPITSGEMIFKMPHGAAIVDIGTDEDNLPHIWVMADKERQLVNRTIIMYGSGYNTPVELPKHPGLYIGHVKIDNLVWHVFDLGAKREAAK